MLFAMKSLWQQGWEWVTACMHYQSNYFFQQSADVWLSAKHLSAFLTCEEYFFPLFTSYCRIGKNVNLFDFYVAFRLRILHKFYFKKRLNDKKKWMPCSLYSINKLDMWTNVCSSELGGWVKCATIRDDASPKLMPGPSEVDTCTPSSVGFIVRLWLRYVSVVHRWRDQAANRALHPISGYQCSSVLHWRQGLSMWDTPSGSHLNTQLTPTGCLF